MIYLFSDFGWSGPYIGEMKAAIMREQQHTAVVDLMHDAPAFNPRAAAYLLAALSKQFRSGDICLAVVDPGVGDYQRRAIIIEADGVRYIGPDNGLFAVLVRRARQASCQEIIWRPPLLSNSFHGRDLFAPVAARLCNEHEVESSPLALDSMTGFDSPADVAEVIYIDHYGNVVTGMTASQCSHRTRIQVSGRYLAYAHTFSEVPVGEVFWYENSMGLIEFAANQANAQQLLGATVGTTFTLSE